MALLPCSIKGLIDAQPRPSAGAPESFESSIRITATCPWTRRLICLCQLDSGINQRNLSLCEQSSTSTVLTCALFPVGAKQGAKSRCRRAWESGTRKWIYCRRCSQPEATYCTYYLPCRRCTVVGYKTIPFSALAPLPSFIQPEARHP